MSNQDHSADFSAEEIEAQDAAALPDREAMSLLDVTADLNLALDVAAPIDAAAAVNANAAVPLDASAAANVGSIGSEAAALTDQDSGIAQVLNGAATATTVQDATVTQ